MSHSGPCRPHNRDNPNMTTSSEAEAIIAEGAAMRARMERHRIDVNYGMSINAFRELTAVLECNTMLAEWAALRAKRLSQWYRVQEGAHEVARVEEQSPTAKEDTVVGCVPPRAILVGLRRTFSTPNLRKQFRNMKKGRPKDSTADCMCNLVFDDDEAVFLEQDLRDEFMRYDELLRELRSRLDESRLAIIVAEPEAEAEVESDAAEAGSDQYTHNQYSIHSWRIPEVSEPSETASLRSISQESIHLSEASSETPVTPSSFAFNSREASTPISSTANSKNTFGCRPSPPRNRDSFETDFEVMLDRVFFDHPPDVELQIPTEAMRNVTVRRARIGVDEFGMRTRVFPFPTPTLSSILTTSVIPLHQQYSTRHAIGMGGYAPDTLSSDDFHPCEQFADASNDTARKYSEA